MLIYNTSITQEYGNMAKKLLTDVEGSETLIRKNKLLGAMF